MSELLIHPLSSSFVWWWRLVVIVHSVVELRYSDYKGSTFCMIVGLVPTANWVTEGIWIGSDTLSELELWIVATKSRSHSLLPCLTPNGFLTVLRKKPRSVLRRLFLLVCPLCVSHPGLRKIRLNPAGGTSAPAWPEPNWPLCSQLVE